MTLRICRSFYAAYTAEFLSNHVLTFRFLEPAGLDAQCALNFTLGKHGINMLGIFGAWFLMSPGSLPGR